MEPTASAADRTTPALSSVPDAKTMVSVGELKRNSLRDSLRKIHDRASSILLFSLQWKDLEDHYAAAEASLKRRSEELEALEGSVVRKLKEAGRWARMLGDRAEAKIRVLEDKVGGLAVRERGFGREIEERLREVEEVKRRVGCEGAAVFKEMTRRGEELDGLVERVRVKEEMIQRRETDLGIRLKLVEDVERELEEGRREVGSKERELNEALELIMSREKEIEEREKERVVKGREIEEKMAEIVSREKEREMKGREIEKKMAEIASREKAVGERVKLAELKDAESEGKLRELSLKRKELNKEFGRVRLMEEELVRRGGEMESRDKEIEKKMEVVELKEKMFEDLREEIESKKKDIVDRVKGIRLKEKGLSDCSKEIELRSEEASRNYEMKMTELKLREKSLEEWAKQIEQKGREVNRIAVEADLKKKTIEDPGKEIEERRKVSGPSMKRLTLAQHDTEGEPAGEPAKKSTLAEGETALDGVLSHDGKALQIFLIENWQADASFRRKISEIIKACPNPARLVLDALQAFYPSRDKRDNLEAKYYIIRKESCLLLLEELRNINPEIGRTEKDEALKLSLFWYRTMRGDAEIVNFFYLLAAYELASSYFDDILLKLVGRVRNSRKMPELCRVLGFADRMPGFVRDLVKFNNLPTAIRFINAFKLNGVFPVEALINKCIRNSAYATNAGRHNQSNYIRAQKRARKRRLAEMNALMECIEEYQIRSKHTERIREIIFSIGGHIPNLERGANRVGKICCSTNLTASSQATVPQSVYSDADKTSEVPLSCQLGKQSKVAAPADARQSSLDAANPIHHPSKQQARIEQVVTFESKKSQSNELSGKVDGKSLKIILGGEVDCDKAHEKACKLLHGSTDPARLVLDALKDNVSSDPREEEGFKLGMPLKVCIQLLELLKRVSPMISQQLREDAREFAVSWKTNLKARADDYMGIVCFLLFLSAFKLSSAFNAGEIVGLLDPTSWRKHVLHTCETLGLKDAIPDFIQRLIDKNNWLNAIKYAHTFGMEDKFPLEPLLKDYMAYWENKVADLCKAHPGSPMVQMNAIEKMLTATSVVIKCINFYKLESRCLMKDLEARVQQLETQKAEIANKLKDSNVEHSDRSNSPALEQEMVKERIVTGNSPSASSNDNSLVSANVPTSAKTAVAAASCSASSKDNAQASANKSTFAKTAVPGNSPSTSSNADVQVLVEMATSSKDAKSGSGEMRGGKRSRKLVPGDTHEIPPQAKRQAQGPSWGQSAPPPYFNPALQNYGPLLPLPPQVHSYHQYAQLEEVKKSVSDCSMEFELKKTKLGQIQSKIVDCNRELQEKEERLSSLNSSLEKSYVELDTNAKNFRKLSNFITSLQQKHHLSVNSQEGRSVEVDLQLPPRTDTVHPRRQIKIEPMDNGPSVVLSTPSPALSCRDSVPLDYKRSICEQFEEACQSGCDPAEIVLDTIQQARDQLPSTWDAGLGTGDLMDIVALLERLMESPRQMTPGIMERALEEAVEWMTKLRDKAGSPSEVSVLLHFVAAYKLMSYFHRDELSRLAETLSATESDPRLCQALGITDKNSGTSSRCPLQPHRENKRSGETLDEAHHQLLRKHQMTQRRGLM